jgi:hypothetical protein
VYAIAAYVSTSISHQANAAAIPSPDEIESSRSDHLSFQPELGEFI